MKILSQNVEDTTPKKKTRRTPEQWIDREERVQLTRLHHLTFSADYRGCQNKRIALTNISSSGIGLVLADIPDSLQADLATNFVIKGVIHIEENHYEISIRVAHIDSEMVGCKILKSSSDFKQMILDYFDMELSALSMKKTEKTTDNKIQIQFQNNDICDLKIELLKSNSEMESFSLSFFGFSIKWDTNRGLQYGQIFGQDSKESTLEIGSQLPMEIRESALKFISNLKELPSPIKTKIYDKIRKK